MRTKTSLILISLLLVGCATVGPRVSRDEIARAREELEVKALDFRIRQLLWVNNVGYRILKALPEEDRKGDFPYTGLFFMQIDEKAEKLYGLSRDEGVVVVGVVKGSPAEAAGLRPGDIIISLDEKRIRSVRDLGRYLSKSSVGETIALSILRDDEVTLPIKVGKIPLRVSFGIVDQDIVNAYANPNIIVVTYGMTRFLKSDDELAVILGHEVAHITRGHHGKGFFTDLLITLGSFALGSALGFEGGELFEFDDMMGPIKGGLRAGFSRDLEREADYFGTKYAYYAGYDIRAGVKIWERFAIEAPKTMVQDFLSTHPASPERMLRIEKTIQELEGKD
jgi:membrane-associated protease RseP (regulator of RpoE activity)